jgi:hypothetical protein
MKGRTVQLTGFVTPGSAGTWYLSRLVVTCCAADAQVLKIEMHGTTAPPADAWVTVTGRWRAHREGRHGRGPRRAGRVECNAPRRAQGSVPVRNCDQGNGVLALNE